MFKHLPEQCEEEVVCIRHGTTDLYGVIYSTVDNPKAVIIICAPDADERYWSQRVLVNTARMLAASGYLLVRFDYMGQGESEGRYEDGTVKTRINDIRCVVKWIKNKVNKCKIGLLGVRYGGTLAIKAALDKENAIEFLVLWEPVLQVANYMDSQLRINTTTQMVMHKKVLRTREQLKNDIICGKYISINGYNLAKEFFEESVQINAVEDLKNYEGDVLNILGKKIDTQNLQSPEKPVKLNYPIFWRDHKIYWEFPNDLINVTTAWLQNSVSKE